jgi:membrane-associated phospholipid phosphatase
MAVTYGLKYTISEKRPNGGSRSFPSGHTSLSFSAAEFMRKRYGWEYGVPAYAVASFVGYSRVESNQHHPRDVFAGAAIGILSSYIFTRPYAGWNIQAEGDTRYFGIRLTRAF